MNSHVKTRCQKISIFTGAFLLILFLMVPFYWGNLSVLTLSYIVYSQPSSSGVDTPWIISAYSIVFSFGVIVYDLMRTYCGKRFTILFGVFISNAAFFLCYFAMQHSLGLVNVLLGACEGFSGGVLLSHSLRTVLDLTEHNVSLLTVFVQASFNVGAIFVNEFSTRYANPDNLSPARKIGFSLYFTEIRVLERIPFLFLFIGGFALAVSIIAYFLLMQEETLITETFTSDKSICHEGGVSNGDSVSKTDDNYSPEGLSSQQVLKAPAFYAFWFNIFSVYATATMFNNYYKQFGQLWIHDDHFLTDLGTINMIVNAVMRLFLGILFDRFNTKWCWVWLQSATILFNVWYYFTPRLGRWIYLIECVLFDNLLGAAFTIHPVITVYLFGKTNFSRNFGLINTAGVIYHVIGPFLQPFAIHSFGWFFTYGTFAFINFISLILIVLFVP